MKIPKSDLQLEEDPYLRLGYGMNSYFDVVISLFSMMVFISVFAFVWMGFYAKFGAYAGSKNEYIT